MVASLSANVVLRFPQCCSYITIAIFTKHVQSLKSCSTIYVVGNANKNNIYFLPQFGKRLLHLIQEFAHTYVLKMARNSSSLCMFKSVPAR